MIGKKFIYENILLDEARRVVSFVYRIETDEEEFQLTEKVTFASTLPDNPTIDRHLRALHLALGISYYKIFVPPKIDHAYRMDEKEAVFWNIVFRHGLGEFLYKNNLPASKLARFTAQKGSVIPDNSDSVEWKQRALLGIGGGKDSIVAGELLKEIALPVSGFVLATGTHQGLARNVAKTMRVELHGIEREIDPLLLELNRREGAFNGHIPISLIFALSGCLLAASRGDKYVVVANEASASIPQVEHEGEAVNHQWSKSFDFETLFQDYVHGYLSVQLHYFSAIRPLSSVAVAKIFARYPNYFSVFTSDNSHFKMNRETRKHPRWSHDSPKTLSSFILLSPWIDPSTLIEAFGGNYLEQQDLSQLLLDLLGKGEKPVLDCVGTPHELRLCLSIASSNKAYATSSLVNYARNQGLLMDDIDAMLAGALRISSEHAIPDSIAAHLLEKMEEKLR